MTTPPSKIRIMLLDEHSVVRDGLKHLINAQLDMEVVADAGDVRRALDLCGSFRPDVALTEVVVGPVSGAAIAREIRKRSARTKVLALSAHEDSTYIQGMLAAGASGYLLKRAAGAELLHAIRAVAVDGVFVDDRIAGKLISGLTRSRAHMPNRNDQLSERETEVMRLVAQGFTNKEISTKLGVSVKTVETYKARSMTKLGLHSRVDVVRFASIRGWLAGQWSSPQDGPPLQSSDVVQASL